MIEFLNMNRLRGMSPDALCTYQMRLCTETTKTRDPEQLKRIRDELALVTSVSKQRFREAVMYA